MSIARMVAPIPSGSPQSFPRSTRAVAHKFETLLRRRPRQDKVRFQSLVAWAESILPQFRLKAAFRPLPAAAPWPPEDGLPSGVELVLSPRKWAAQRQAKHCRHKMRGNNGSRQLGKQSMEWRATARLAPKA